VKVLVDIDANAHGQPDPFTIRQIIAVQRWVDVHNAIASRETAIEAFIEVTARPDEIGESFIWTRLRDCYMPLRRFIYNGESSKWLSAEDWEHNPWFP